MISILDKTEEMKKSILVENRIFITIWCGLSYYLPFPLCTDSIQYLC
jgi:hypothetical protein